LNRIITIVLFICFASTSLYATAFQEEWDTYSENKKISMLIENPTLVKEITNISEDLLFKAIKKNYKIFYQLTNPSEELRYRLIKAHVISIQGMKRRGIIEHSNRIKLASLSRNVRNIEYIDNPTQKMQLMAVTEDYELIDDIKNPVDSVRIIAIKNNYHVEKHTPELDNKSHLEIINFDPYLFAYLTYPTEEIQLMSVKQNGNNIKYIKNPSEKVQLAAVRQNTTVIKYIKSPTAKVKSILTNKKTSITEIKIGNDSRKIFDKNSPNFLESYGKIITKNKNDKVGATCTGNLVAYIDEDLFYDDKVPKKNYFVTSASHCFNDMDLNKIYIHFNKKNGQKITRKLTLIVDNKEYDYAVLKMKHPISTVTITPIVISNEMYQVYAELSLDNITAAGYSSDIYKGDNANNLTYDQNCKIIRVFEGIIVTNCTMYPGASGGALVSHDYLYDSDIKYPFFLGVNRAINETNPHDSRVTNYEIMDDLKELFNVEP